MQHTVSALLHDDVNTYASHLIERSELLKRARGGALGADAVLAYLTGLRYLTEQTPRLLDIAAESAERQDRTALAAHFRAKRGEEVGHHLWAESDMRGIARVFQSSAEFQPSHALVALVTYLEQEIEVAPVRYLAYGLLAEYTTVAVGPAWVRALEENCGIGAENLTVVTRHIVLDADHVSEGLEEIAALSSEADLPGMQKTIRESIGYLDAFLSELLEVAEAA
jgi:hypothetical protein